VLGKGLRRRLVAQRSGATMKEAAAQRQENLARYPAETIAPKRMPP
jgi:hypothetical protein